MARTRLHLERFQEPMWKRPGAMQGALLLLAALPLLAALVLRVQPGASAPRIEQVPAPTGLALQSIERTEAPLRALDLIASRNMFSPLRTDWTLADAGETVVETAPSDTDARRLARLKEANEALDKLTFMATMRIDDHWSAYFDAPGRASHDDLLLLSVGDTYQGWTLVRVARDGATFGFETVERNIDLMPRVRRPTGRPATAPAPRGRSLVEVREPTADAGVRVEPPISRTEAERRIAEALGDDARLRRLASELFHALDDDKR
ncbi:MAG: hypothetical protein EA379_10435 [Phycisphaerales bacterium]|nr:MAG: hypothetical protein EA379_10435 [Phycisphaerales bacterium]